MVARSLEPKGRPETPLGCHLISPGRPPPPGARGQEVDRFGATADPKGEAPSLVPGILIATFEPRRTGPGHAVGRGQPGPHRRLKKRGPLAAEPVQPQVWPVLEDGVEDGGDHIRIALTLAERAHPHPGAVSDPLPIPLEMAPVVVRRPSLQHGEEMHARRASRPDGVEPLDGERLVASEGVMALLRTRTLRASRPRRASRPDRGRRARRSQAARPAARGPRSSGHRPAGRRS